MIHFKSRSATDGFMLTEILLAIAIIGIALMPIFGLQSKMVRAVSGISARIQRFFLIENFLVSSREKFLADELEDDNKREKKINAPKTAITYEAKKISDSGIFKKFPGLFREDVDAVWQEGLTKRSELIVSLVYKPEQNPERER